MNQQHEDTTENMVNGPDTSGKVTYIAEGSSKSFGRRIIDRYSPKDAKRLIKLSKSLLPPPIDMDTAVIHFGGGIAIDTIANTVEKSMIAQRQRTQAVTQVKSPEAGHIAPIHMTGPEPAILSHISPIKPPGIIRPVGK